MHHEFTIRDWQAFAPGIHDKLAWQAWAKAPWPPLGEGLPALAEMPPMHRRRVEKLGRMALQVAYWCQPEGSQEVPLVFATRHGDITRTHEMLKTLARDEPLSPTQFGLSTHNAIAAQYSIVRKLAGNYLAVSAGAATAEAAFVEALGLLADGVSEVLVVIYDGHLPDAYSCYADEPDAEYAWACRVAIAKPGESRYSLDIEVDKPAVDAVRMLPHGLEVLRFLISGERTLEFKCESRCWRWRRHD